MASADRWPAIRESWIVHEDDDLVVVDKPAGMAVQPADAGMAGDLRTRLTAHYAALHDEAGMRPRVRPAHGLDREASGLVLVAKHREAGRHLARALEAGLERVYVVGVAAPAKGRRKAPWREEVVAKRDGRALVRITWDARTQPLRRRLGQRGTAIAGDPEGLPAARLMLHVAALRVPLVHGGERVFESATPAPMRAWLAGEDGWSDLAGTLERAHDARYALAQRTDLDAFRWLHGAGDGLPGASVDHYGDHLVVAVDATLDEAREDALLGALEAFNPRGIYLKRRPKRASDLVSTRRDEVAPAQAVRGDSAPDPSFVTEGGVRYRCRLGDGLSTGIFLDMREGRAAIAARARGARLLNLFCYHAAFSVAAAQAGARGSVNVDSSGAALEAARLNLDAAGADPEAHVMVKADAIAWCERAARRGERFELIALDPPSFSTTKRGRFRAERDYRRLAAAALGCLADGGTLLACTNHRQIKAERWLRELAAAAEDASRAVASIERLPDPVDFPPPPGEACHLKTALITLEP